MSQPVSMLMASVP